MITITLCLIAVGLSVMVFRNALRGAIEGHEGNHGFYQDTEHE